MSQKPWEHAKSSGSEADPVATRFVASLDVDQRLYPHDIAGSIAHATMLHHVGLLTVNELDTITTGLNAIKSEIDEQGESWPGWKVELEDVHMCIEAALIEKIGEPGRRLHTGRSRNDQVALDMKLWIDQSIAVLLKKTESLAAAFAELADRCGEVIMPSYTHMQRAQPIVAGGEALAWASCFNRCGKRFWQLDDRLENPLGCGAIAGSSLPLDRQFSASMCDDINAIAPSSMIATASRDATLDMAYGLSMVSMWLSRWAEQWIIYNSTEFSFITLGDAYTTGSSMMPQKRNPDMLELIRGKTGQVYGSLVALLTMCKGLTIGYNRDLQEDKRHLFSAY
ncbi:MAG: argininosuccinate lyase, partial [Planctomycetota bacterium]